MADADPYARHAERYLKRLQDLSRLHRTSAERIETLLEEFDKHRPQIDAAFAWAERNLDCSVDAAVICARFAGCADPRRGNSLLNMRQSHAESHHWIERALASCRRIGSRVNEAIFLGRLAQSEFAAGHLTEATLHAETALWHFLELGDGRRVGITHVLLSQLAFAKQDDEASLGHMEKALAIFQSLGMVDEITRALSSIAVAYLRLRRFEDALRVAERGISFAREHDDRRAEAAALKKLARAYHGLQQEELARKAQAEANTILEQTVAEDSPIAMELRTYEIARLVATGTSWDIDELEEALITFRKLDHWLGEGFALASLGISWVRQGNAQVGIEHLERALDVFTTNEFWIGANAVQGWLVRFR